ncbi:MAG: MATE family efflux transporter [Clostridium sp.]|uniref:MATE family efflux transporter n=1 Tax=Clostridium sp. TaxID=1506 RepID=UPI003069B508
MKDMTTGNEAKLIFNFTLPLLIGSVFQQLYNTVDSIIVGRFLGTEALAAVGTSFPITFLLGSLIMGLTLGSTILISQYFGADDIINVKNTIDTTYIFLFIASFFMTILGLLLSGPILKIINVPQEIYDPSKTYLDIMFIGLICQFGYNSVSSILRGLGDSKTPVYFLILASIVNIFLDIIFIVSFNMGIAGAALATIISQGLSFILAILYLNKRHDIFRISLKNIKFHKEIFMKTVKIGLPSGIQQMVFSLGSITMQSIVNGFGGATVAAYAAAAKIDNFASMPVMNFGAAISTFVGQNIGAKKFHRIKNGLKSTLIMSSIISILVYFFLRSFGPSLMRLFTTDPEVISEGIIYINTISPFYAIVGAMFITTGVLRGAGDSIFPMVVSILSLWIIRIPLAYFFSSFLGTKGIWMSIPTAWTFGMIATFIYYKLGKWKKKSIIDDTNENLKTAS